MLEILKFIFSSFWVWFGILCYIAIITFGVAEIIILLRKII